MSTPSTKHFVDFSELHEKDSSVREAYCKSIGGWIHYKEIPATEYIVLVEEIDSDETKANKKASLMVELIHRRLCSEDGSEYAPIEEIAKLSLRILHKINDEINEARDKGEKRGNG